MKKTKKRNIKIKKIPHQRGAQAWINKLHRKGVKNEELEKTVGIWSNRSKKSVMEKEKITENQYNKKKSFLSTVYNLITGVIPWKKKEKKTYASNLEEIEKNCQYLEKKSWEINSENLKYDLSDKRCFYTIVERDVCQKVADLQREEKRFLTKIEINRIRKDRIDSLARYNIRQMNNGGRDRYVPKEYHKYLE